MKLSTRLAVALGSTALAIAGLAAPAQAAPTPATLYFGGVAASPTNCATLADVGIWSDAAHTTAVSSITGTQGSVNIQNDCSTYPVAYIAGSSSGTMTGTIFGVGYSTFMNLSGSGTFTLYRCPLGTGNGSTSNCASPIANNSVAATASYTLTGGGGGGGPAPSSSRTTATTETLTLAVATSGATCTGGNPSGVTGSWLTLPSADQCTQSGPSAKSDAKLLGWSTHPIFPISRAQSQIDKHWGVIDETIDGVRMIFIPAGMATFVSGANNLFPVWSK